MGRVSAGATSGTLLGRLRGQSLDQAAWEEFVRRYSPRIYQWCRKWRLQEADAKDVTQDVLLKLASRMRTFDYDPARSFRSWLRTVTQSALSDFFAERRRAERSTPELDELPARESLLDDLNEEFDREVLEEAMARVELRVSPHRWQAFRLTALEGLSGAEAATRLGMPVATVFTAKSKIHRLVQQEVQRLNAGDP
jgi:RNA polymerase sigma factor (sigma-70 family)